MYIQIILMEENHTKQNFKILGIDHDLKSNNFFRHKSLKGKFRYQHLVPFRYRKIMEYSSQTKAIH